MLREQTFERHPLDRRVLLSQNLADIQRVDGTNFKAGIIKQAADDEMAAELLAIPRDASYLVRPLSAFYSAAKAPPVLRQDLSERSLARIADLSEHFRETAKGGAISILLAHNLAKSAASSVLLHYEGWNPNGPSQDRAFRGNLSVSRDKKSQLCWVPTDGLTEEDIDAILDPHSQREPVYELQAADSGDFVALHGLDYQYSNRLTDGLLHAGPDPHDRFTIIWGLRHE